MNQSIDGGILNYLLFLQIFGEFTNIYHYNDNNNNNNNNNNNAWVLAGYRGSSCLP